MPDTICRHLNSTVLQFVYVSHFWCILHQWCVMSNVHVTFTDTWPYWITPPDIGERTPTNPSQKGWYSINLPRRDGRLSWLRWLVAYREWFTRPQTVTHPSINWAWHRAVTVIKTNALLLRQATTCNSTGLLTEHVTAAWVQSCLV